MGKKVGIADVARAVGVSKTTVSRYLHGDFTSMSSDTRVRIQQTIGSLGYRPNKLAQGLKSRSSHSIGVTIADIGNPFSSLLLKGVQAECRARHIQLLVCDSTNSQDIELHNVESLIDAQVDGVIINTVGGDAARAAQYGQIVGRTPAVLLDRTIPGAAFDTVCTNNGQITRAMMEHLEHQGFTYIAYVTHDVQNISTRTRRLNTVAQFLRGRSIGGEALIYSADSDDLGQRIRALLDKHLDERVCLFANNEESLADVLDALAACNGTSVPHRGMCIRQ